MLWQSVQSLLCTPNGMLRRPASSPASTSCSRVLKEENRTSARLVTPAASGRFGEIYSTTVRFIAMRSCGLRAQKSGRDHEIAGGNQGRVPVREDRVTGVKMVQRSTRFDDYCTQVRSAHGHPPGRCGHEDSHINRGCIPPCLILSVNVAFAQGTVAGYILDETGAPCIGYTVMLVGTLYGGSTDDNGRYLILNVPTGTYAVRYSMVGMEPSRSECRGC